MLFGSAGSSALACCTVCILSEPSSCGWPLGCFGAAGGAGNFANGWGWAWDCGAAAGRGCGCVFASGCNCGSGCVAGFRGLAASEKGRIAFLPGVATGNVELCS